MNITIESHLQKYDQEMLFFRSLKSKMQVFPTRKIAGMVRVVLTSVIRNIPTKQVSEVVNKLPSTLQQIFVGSWDDNVKCNPVAHLDHLVENICKAEAEKEILFTNEVEALKYTSIVVKNLKTVFDKVGVSIFPYSMISQYEQAAQEGAV